MSLVTLALLAAATVWLVIRLKGGSMSPTLVKEKISSGALVLDVRSPAEFRSGAYPGAVNIPLQDLGRRLGEIAQDQSVVVYCASGARSSAAANLMKQAGFRDVVNAGGLMWMPR